MFIISLVALERYMAICRPAIHRQTNSRTRAMRLSLLSWIISLAIVACYTGAFSMLEVCIVFPAAPNVSIPFQICVFSDLAYRVITLIEISQFLLGCIGNCTLYVCIVRRLNKRKGRNTSRERNHVAKMLTINACVFFVCLAPVELTEFVNADFDIFGLVPDLLSREFLSLYN